MFSGERASVWSRRALNWLPVHRGLKEQELPRQPEGVVPHAPEKLRFLRFATALYIQVCMYIRRVASPVSVDTKYNSLVLYGVVAL